VTPQAPARQVPGASSPLTRAMLSGPARPGLVLASFPTALYLSMGGHHEVLPVVTSDALMLPTATRLGAPGRELVWAVEPGDTVIVGRSRIELPGWRVHLVREWRPARVGSVRRIAEPRLLSDFADMLLCHASSPELVDRAAGVCRAALFGDPDEVRDRAGQLLGAGPGLTPSGDDALCAVLLVLRGVGKRSPASLLGSAVRSQWTCTTSLSASLLDAARGGYAVADVVALVELALRGDLAGAHPAVTSTMSIGHSSGADLIAGLAGALHVLADEDARSPIPAR